MYLPYSYRYLSVYWHFYFIFIRFKFPSHPPYIGPITVIFPTDSLFTRAAYLFLENPAVGKDKVSRESIFALLGTLVMRYNHMLGAVTSIIHLLPHFDHLAAVMAQLVEVFVQEYGAARVVGEVARSEFL